MLAVCIKRTPKWHFWFFFACLDIQWVSEWARETATAAIYRFYPFSLIFFLSAAALEFFFFSFQIHQCQWRTIVYFSPLLLSFLIYTVYCVFSSIFIRIRTLQFFIFHFAWARFSPFYYFYYFYGNFWENRAQNNSNQLGISFFVRLISTLILD